MRRPPQTVRIIGDVHAKYSSYLNIIKDCEYSLQLGDMGFDYSQISKRDTSRHKFILGNHEVQRNLIEDKGCLKNFGLETIGDFTFFYVAGSFSIDWQLRMTEYLKGGQQTWNEDEELSQFTLREAVRTYAQCQPEIVISHDCPLSIARKMSGKEVLRNFGYVAENFMTRTQLALEFMFQTHQPKFWFFVFM